MASGTAAFDYTLMLSCLLWVMIRAVLIALTVAGRPAVLWYMPWPSTFV